MPSEKEKVAIVSVVASGSLATAKFVVGIMIGSLGLISDALHSLTDFGATLVTLSAVKIADRPPWIYHSTDDRMSPLFDADKVFASYKKV